MISPKEGVSRHFGITSDGSRMVLLFAAQPERDPYLLHEAFRAKNGVFAQPRLITELAEEPMVKSPWLSRDGLTIVYQRGVPRQGAGVEFYLTTRVGLSSPWSAPKPLPLQRGAEFAIISWPALSDDELTLWLNKGGGCNSLADYSKRRSVGEPFAIFEPYLLNGQTQIGRSPRYSDATGELILARPADLNFKSPMELWVVKDAFSGGF